MDRSGTELVSRRQLRVLELVARGYKNKEVAKELRIGEPVVRNYLRKIYEKIGVSKWGRTRIVVLVSKAGGEAAPTQ